MFELLAVVALAIYAYRQIMTLRARLDRAEREIDILRERSELRLRRSSAADWGAPPVTPEPSPGTDEVAPPAATTPPPTSASPSTVPPPPPGPSSATDGTGSSAASTPRIPRPPQWSAPPLASAPATAPATSLEETIGSRWAVYAGGLALALGAVFLVNYTIEQGLLGPGPRVVIGLLLAAALVGAGEWFRRTDRRLGFHDTAEAHIPSVLTAAGTVAAFATIYAAHALYGFIGSAVAFVTLGAVGVATMLAAALHGPALAGLGLAGSYVTPLLVSSASPNPWPVVIFLAVVATTAQVLALLRRWTWLAATTVAGSVGWGMVLLDTATRPLRFPPPPAPVIDPVTGLATYAPPVAPVPAGGWLEATYLHAGLQLALAVTFIALAPHVGLLLRRSIEQRAATRSDWIATACLAGHALLALVILVEAPQTDALWAIYASASVAMLAVTAYLAAPLAAVAVLAGLLVSLTLLTWPTARDALLMDPFASLGPLLGYPTDAGVFVTFAIVGALTPAVASVLRLWRGKPLTLEATALYALAATAMPLLALVLAYVRAGELTASTTYMSAAFLLAGAYAGLSEVFHAMASRAAALGVPRIEQSAGQATADDATGEPLTALRDEAAAASRLASGAFAAATVAALAIGITIIADRHLLAAALAITALATAWIATVRDLPLLRPVVSALGLVVAARLLIDPVLFGLDVGRLPILNWLLVIYGIPAASFIGASHLLRQSRTEPDLAVHVSEGLALLLTALLAFFEIRHLTNGGNVLSPSSGHVEQGLLAMTSLGLSQIAARLHRQLRGAVLEAATYAFSGLALAFAVLGLGIGQNPYFSGEPVAGPIILNSLALAYLAPGIMALYLARISQGVRSELFVRIAGIVGLVLVVLYVTLEVRHIFQGAFIGASRRTGSAEVWGYTVAWLLLGVVLLGYGLYRDLVMPRIASAALIVAAALKVVMIDLAGISGLWRALSFLCLGAVLIGIGLVYQRLIFAKPAGTASAAPPSSGPT